MIAVQNAVQLPEHVRWLLQTAVALSDSDAHDEPARLIQTHISYVVLAGRRAYKLKKPVDFGFLDYRSLERRRHFCREEVRLNSRLSPDVYLGTQAIRRSETGDYSLGDGDGEVVDWVVVMQRIPTASMFDTMLDHGDGRAAQARVLAEVIAAFHLRAETNERISAFGSVAALRRNWDESFEQTAPCAGVLLSHDDYDALRSYVERFLRANRALIERRIADGYIRDGHGDLRASSVAFTPDGVRVLDCIEFNDRFRCGDVASDVAFLLMDLERRGRMDLADEFLARYLSVTHDHELPLLLNFYRCYRAYVRGKVNAFQLDEAEVPAAQKIEAEASARGYFALALNYARRDQPARLVALFGATGSGKSYCAGALAGRLGARIIASDPTRKTLAGIATTARSGAEGVGDGIYADAISDRTYAAMLEAARATLRSGVPVVLDATYVDARHRASLLALAAETGVACDFLLCEADQATVSSRIHARRTDCTTASEGTWQVYVAQRERLRSLDDVPAARLHRIETGGSVAAAVEQCLAALAGAGTGVQQA